VIVGNIPLILGMVSPKVRIPFGKGTYRKTKKFIEFQMEWEL
jgi:hypothetical protein